MVSLVFVCSQGGGGVGVLSVRVGVYPVQGRGNILSRGGVVPCQGPVWVEGYPQPTPIPQRRGGWERQGRAGALTR